MVEEEGRLVEVGDCSFDWASSGPERTVRFCSENQCWPIVPYRSRKRADRCRKSLCSSDVRGLWARSSSPIALHNYYGNRGTYRHGDGTRSRSEEKRFGASARHA